MIEMGKKYRHYKNGKDYITVDFCKIQLNDVWVESVLYKNIDNSFFARTVEEFSQKFKKVSEIEEQKQK